MTDIFPVVKQYNNELEKLLGQTRQLITHYQNLLFKEEADTNRLVVLEEIGTTAAGGGSVDLTRRIVQPVVITGLLVNFDVSKDIILTIGRYSQDINNAQSRVQVISPVQYPVGPGDIIKISWASGVTPTQPPYFAAFGKLVGSHFG